MRNVVFFVYHRHAFTVPLILFFRKFETWIFHGFIEDPYKELFIEFVDFYQPNTKHFWDKAYTIKRPSVPSFLHGCEESALLCGKYTMLLKTIKSSVRFFFNQNYNYVHSNVSIPASLSQHTCTIDSCLFFASTNRRTAKQLPTVHSRRSDAVRIVHNGASSLPAKIAKTNRVSRTMCGSVSRESETMA